MTTARRVRARIGVLAALAFLLLVSAARGDGTSAAAESKSFSLPELITEATVASDGSMAVTEHIMYVFRGGPFNFGIRSFLPADRSRITDFHAADANGTPLGVIAPSDSVLHEWEWRLGAVSDTSVTYTLTYRVPRAITLGPDVGELYWQFLGKDHPGVGHLKVTIAVPGPFTVATNATAPTDTIVLRGWGHGPRQGTVKVDPSQVVLDVSRVPAGQFVEARLAIPASAFTGDATTGPRLAKIIDEEGSFVDATLAEDKGRSGAVHDHQGLGNLLAPGAGLFGLAGLAALWVGFGREPKPDPMIGEYWREPLDDPPAIVLANLSKGTVPLGPAFGSTVIDLAQRGYLTIREESHERLGPDDVTHRFVWAGKPTTDLLPFERDLLEHVFLGKNEVTTDDVSDWAKANRVAAQKFAKSFQSEAVAIYDLRRYKAKKLGPASAVLVAVALGVGVLGFVANHLGSKLGFIAYIAAVLVLVAGSLLLVNRTQKGADEKAKADALKRFLKDFSNLKEAPAGHLVLWERYLVYAVTLGVAKELLQGLQVRLPAVANDPNYAIWYVALGPGRHFDHLQDFNRTFGAQAATAMAPPSKSGGGGGFSGGGGGGGGGGGFGAR